jgi:hypothetical protein
MEYTKEIIASIDSLTVQRSHLEAAGPKAKPALVLWVCPRCAFHMTEEKTLVCSVCEYKDPTVVRAQAPLPPAAWV